MSTDVKRKNLGENFENISRNISATRQRLTIEKAQVLNASTVRESQYLKFSKYVSFLYVKVLG